MVTTLQGRARQTGLSLIELMISMVIGLVILAGVTTIFVANNKTRLELEKTSRQIENGRYAMQLITEDLQMAGYLGSYVPSTTAPTLTALPDPCSTDMATIDGARLLHVQGYDEGAGAPTCLSDVKSGTDILVVRRASTCVAGSTNCDAFAVNAPHLQVSGCSTDTKTYMIGGGASAAAAATSTNGVANAAAGLTLKRVGCGSTADILRYRTHIYFIADNNIGSDGVPTLKRAELGDTMSIVPLVEGIDNMQFEYGVDTNADAAPNAYTANPTTYNSCAGNDCVRNWWNVMAVKVNVLARNTEPTTRYVDAKAYTLGLDAAGDPNTFGPYSDAYKRHAYTGVVRLANPAGRRQ